MNTPDFSAADAFSGAFVAANASTPGCYDGRPLQRLSRTARCRRRSRDDAVAALRKKMEDGGLGSRASNRTAGGRAGRQPDAVALALRMIGRDRGAWDGGPGPGGACLRRLDHGWAPAEGGGGLRRATHGGLGPTRPGGA